MANKKLKFSKRTKIHVYSFLVIAPNTAQLLKSCWLIKAGHCAEQQGLWGLAGGNLDDATSLENGRAPSGEARAQDYAAQVPGRKAHARSQDRA